MFCTILLVAVFGFPWISAELTTTSVTEVPNCDPKCGCDGYYIFDEVKNDCVLNLANLMKSEIIKYDARTDELNLGHNRMAKAIYEEGQKIFRGILISVILFLTCAAICVLSACLYCCRINYSDRQLKREVKSLAKQMHKKCPKTKTKPQETDPKSQSCNVIVEGAGVFVV